MKAVLMPALGVAMTEGLVVRWLKRPGDDVAEGEPLLEIETDKSIVEVPSPSTGIVGQLLFAEGDVVPTGTALTYVSDGPGDDLVTPVASPVAAPPPSPGIAATGVMASAAPVPSPADPTARAPHTMSPRERRLAQERADAEAAGGAGPAGHDSPVMATPAAGRYRSLIAAKVLESWTTMPHFSVTREVDAAAMVDVRARFDDGRRPSFTDLMLRALALALRAAGEQGAVDVGLAVATPNGVVIPIVRGVLDMDLGELRRARESAVGRAREDRLRADDLGDPPRSTLSNLGTLGVDAFTGVIALGQTSLLTVGRILARPYVNAGALAIRDSFHATLNVDHRVLDGEEAARLLVAFVSAVEDTSSIADAEGRL